MSNESAQRLTKNERREQAREKARAAREAEVKKQKRNRLFLQGGIALAVVAIIAIVGLVIAQAVKPAGPGPANMASGGVVFEGEDFSVQPTPALADGEELVAAPTDRTEVPLDIVIYVDYHCPHCGLFEQEAGPMLEQWIGSGQATLQVYPMNIMDNASGGAKYSTRSANAVACVVDQQPEAAWGLHTALLSPEVQPEGGTSGLSTDELIALAEDAGAQPDADLVSCIRDVQFSDFINKSTNTALSGPVLGLAEGAQLSDGANGLQSADEPQRITGTPTVLVNGMQAPTGVAELEQFMLKLFSDLTENGGAENGVDGSEDAEAETDTGSVEE